MIRVMHVMYMEYIASCPTVLTCICKPIRFTFAGPPCSTTDSQRTLRLQHLFKRSGMKRSQHPSAPVQAAWWAGLNRPPLSTSPTAAPVLCSKPTKSPCHQWSGSRHSEVLSWLRDGLHLGLILYRPPSFVHWLLTNMCNDVHLEQS